MTAILLPDFLNSCRALFLKNFDFWKMIILVVVIWDQIGPHGVTGVIAAPLVVKTRLITDIERALMVSGILF